MQSNGRSDLKAVNEHRVWRAAWRVIRVLLVIGLFALVLSVVSVFMIDAVRVQNCRSWSLEPGSGAAPPGSGWRITEAEITPRVSGYEAKLSIGGHVQVLDASGTPLFDQDWSTGEESCGLLGGCSEIPHYSTKVYPELLTAAPGSSLMVILVSGEYKENHTLVMPEPSPPLGVPSDRSLSFINMTLSGRIDTTRHATVTGKGDHFSITLSLTGYPTCRDTAAFAESTDPRAWLLSVAITGIVVGAVCWWTRER